jgi:hypothetical protein
VLDARSLEGDVRHPSDDGFGAIERCGVRQLRDGDQVALVLARYESLRYSRESDNANQNQYPVHCERNDGAMRHTLYDGAVALG